MKNRITILLLLAVPTFCTAAEKKRKVAPQKELATNGCIDARIVQLCIQHLTLSKQSKLDQKIPLDFTEPEIFCGNFPSIPLYSRWGLNQVSSIITYVNGKRSELDTDELETPYFSGLLKRTIVNKWKIQSQQLKKLCVDHGGTGKILHEEFWIDDDTQARLNPFREDNDTYIITCKTRIKEKELEKLQTQYLDWIKKIDAKKAEQCSRSLIPDSEKVYDPLWQ